MQNLYNSFYNLQWSVPTILQKLITFLVSDFLNMKVKCMQNYFHNIFHNYHSYCAKKNCKRLFCFRWLESASFSLMQSIGKLNKKSNQSDVAIVIDNRK